MLSKVNKNVNAEVSVNISGESKVDDEMVARYSAHTDFNSDDGSLDDGSLIINITIYDKDKFKSECSEDEEEFKDAAYDFEKQVMDKEDEILGLFQDGESDEKFDEDSDEQDPDGKVSSGNEETIIP